MHITLCVPKFTCPDTGSMRAAQTSFSKLYKIKVNERFQPIWEVAILKSCTAEVQPPRFKNVLLFLLETGQKLYTREQAHAAKACVVLDPIFGPSPTVQDPKNNLSYMYRVPFMLDLIQAVDRPHPSVHIAKHAPIKRYG